MTVQTILVNTPSTTVQVHNTTKIAVATPGPQGRTGLAGGEGLTFVQAAPTTQWTVNHGMGREPAVVVIIGGEEVWADITHPTVNTAQINFGTPQAGKAVLI